MMLDIDIPLFKLIRQPVVSVMGSSVDAAPFVIILLILVLAHVALRRNRNLLFLRRASQVLGVMVFIVFLHQCLCMIRGWVFALQTVGKDDLMAFSYLAMFVVLGSTALVFGRVFCGWACPIGFFGELLGKVSRWRGRLTGRRGLLAAYLMLTGTVMTIVWFAWMVKPGTQFFAENVAAIWAVWLLAFLFIALPAERRDRKLKNIKYISLGFWVALSVIGVFVTSPWCTLFGNEVDYSSIVALVAVLAAATIISMSWCRYLCPLGATLGWVATHSTARLHTGDKCTSCDNCHRVCPMGALGQGEVDRSSCISCGNCSSQCGFQWRDSE